MSNDPIREIDMSDPVNFNRAVELALAASDPEGWAEQKAEALHALASPSAELWTVYTDVHNKDGHAVVAITGNGDRSRANAEFFASARKVVLGLVSEVDRLQTILRTQALAASAPAGEQEKTSEAGSTREGPHDEKQTASQTARVRDAVATPSPPAEAPQESGVPSGMLELARRAAESSAKRNAEIDTLPPAEREKAIAEWAHKLASNSVAIGEADANAYASPGTLRGEYERMAREWLEAQYGAHIDERDPDDQVSLTALLARVADERQSAIVEALRNRANAIQITSAPDTTFHFIYDITNYIASNTWRTKGKKEK